MTTRAMKITMTRTTANSFSHLAAAGGGQALLSLTRNALAQCGTESSGGNAGGEYPSFQYNEGRKEPEAALSVKVQPLPCLVFVRERNL
jgi:hypothetical protein